MSQAIYPVLPGLMPTIERTPTFKTDVKGTPSGREFRGSQMASAIYSYSLVYEFLRDTTAYSELRTLIGFFTARRGAFDTFLFDDPDDDTATGHLFATGDGTSTAFQLLRTLGGTAEPIYDLNGAPVIYVNGVAKTLGSDYTVNSTGGVVFATPPAAGLPLTWTGAYYWRCRFSDDTLTVSKFMQSLWEAKKVQFVTVKP